MLKFLLLYILDIDLLFKVWLARKNVCTCYLERQSYFKHFPVCWLNLDPEPSGGRGQGTSPLSLRAAAMINDYLLADPIFQSWYHLGDIC